MHKIISYVINATHLVVSCELGLKFVIESFIKAGLTKVYEENEDDFIKRLESSTCGAVTDLKPTEKLIKFIRSHPNPLLCEYPWDYLPEDLLMSYAIPGHIKAHPKTSEQSEEFLRTAKWSKIWVKADKLENIFK